MCTAATYLTKDFYFGRTLDYEFSYGEEVVVTPRNYPIPLRTLSTLSTHYAMIGVAHVAEGYPLYYDGVNEKGLGVAGLNFVGNACYHDVLPGKENVAQFEFIPWILGRCASVREARELLAKANVTGEAFSANFPVSQMHWLIADREEAIVVEPIKEGLMVYDNPTGVLTNNPPFPEQMFNLNNYMNLSPRPPQNCFSSRLNLCTYSRGMGAMGLPGDLSSQSRFVRVAFTRLNSCSGDSEDESISQFFHILGSVEQQKGCCQLEDGEYEFTIYTSCCNATQGIYYYTTYDNCQISAVDMRCCNLNYNQLIRFPVIHGQQIFRQN